MPNKCCLLDCNSNYDSYLKHNPMVSVYGFPSNPERLSKWLKVIPRKDFNIKVSTVVCIKHFNEKYLERSGTDKKGNKKLFKKPKLKPNAVPTLFGDPLVEVPYSDSECEVTEQKAKKRAVTKKPMAVEVPSVIHFEHVSEILCQEPIKNLPAAKKPVNDKEREIKIRDTCRVCMKSDVRLQSIYTKRKDSLVVALIANLTGIPIFRFDGLPDEICNSCFEKVYEANQTRKLCEDSDRNLKLLLEQIKSMTAQANNETVCAPEFVDKEIGTCFVAHAKSASKSKTIVPNSDEDEDLFDILDETIDTVKVEEVAKPVRATSSRAKNKSNEHDDEPYRFACCMCVNICETEEKLLDHVSTAHEIPPARENQPGKQVECRLCYKRFSKIKNYNNHIKYVYEEKKLCPVCGLAFYERYLHDHVKSHENPDAVVRTQNPQKRTNTLKKECARCGRKFLCNAQLKIHIRAVHFGEKPYACTVCDSTFARKDSLTTHSLKHTRERKYKCSICPKTYIYRSDLYAHRQRHKNTDNERNFPCMVCELKFFNKKQLKAHLQTHTLEATWKCDFMDCDRVYRQQYSLTKHKFADHQIPMKRRTRDLVEEQQQQQQHDDPEIGELVESQDCVVELQEEEEGEEYEYVEMHREEFFKNHQISAPF